MPKLGAKEQQQAADAPEGGGGGPMPEGPVLVQLIEVKVKDEKDRNGFDLWNVEVHVVEPEQYKGRKLFDQISMGETSAWKVRSFFDGFGYTLDTDTAEMIREDAKAVVYTVHEIAQGGKYKGKPMNKIERYADDEEWTAAKTAASDW